MKGAPLKQGLYDPQFEHDACGIGFVAHVKGEKSHDILQKALAVLINLDHRGGQGADIDTGDGAGILLQLPHELFTASCQEQSICLPPPGQYGVGMLFLPQDENERKLCVERLEFIVKQESQQILAWRKVPVNDTSLGSTAKQSQPYIAQVFITPDKDTLEKLQSDDQAFERKLYVIRKLAEKQIRNLLLGENKNFYCASFSSRTIVYKGMLTPEQIGYYYHDLQNPLMKTALALIHSRFSTNTFPSWERAHPYRYIIHNGEINTLRGNINWMKAREALCESDLFNDDMQKLSPVIDESCSDSGMFDNCLEFLYMSGRSLPHAMMMMIPEPWTKHESMCISKKAFFEYHSCLMEPWDGPAAMAFTDGRVIGALLDRNGLRPSRYVITDDNLVILASETGVLDIPPEKIIRKDRLRPGRMILVDTEAGVILNDDTIKNMVASEKPYLEWVDEFMINLENIPQRPLTPPLDKEMLQHYQHAFGYTFEDLTKIIRPLTQDVIDPIGSMGNDIPLAVLSSKPQLLYNYFKQLFAQVTNPPIDAIREEIYTDTGITIGPEKNMLNPQPDSCQQIRLQTPILSNEEFSKIQNLHHPAFKATTLPILFAKGQGGQGLERALTQLCQAADKALADGYNIIILSDRGIDNKFAAIPALLATSCVHHHMIRNRTRLKTSLILETAEPREVHHFALLVGYGASAIYPYLAFETIDDMVKRGLLTDLDKTKAKANYVKSVTKGLGKTLSKMGISTIQGYMGAQIFEAVGINGNVIERYFTWTPSRIGGIGLAEIAEETIKRHSRAFQAQFGVNPALDSGSTFQWRHDGEEHMYNPQTIITLQQACRDNDYELFKKYTNMLTTATHDASVLRQLLSIKKNLTPIPIEEVESIESICHRFKTGAMSYGSLSQEVHECLAIAMNRIGGKSNTGEGGEDPSRFKPDANGDSRRSAIKQVASGRFGVDSNYLVNADEIQIKMAQGAKPGEGGQLPGRKVYPWIAKTRGTTAGVGLISPPPHHDIYSIEDLAELIHDLKNANPAARISVKLVSEVGVGTIAAGVAKARADVILISGFDGGTGASPRTSIRHGGLPWELGLAEVHQTLLLNNLRNRVVIETDGKLMTGRDVVIAALLGAEEFGFATAPLIVLGCVMMRVCNLDTCPVGVATQNPCLRKNFKGDPQYLINFMHFIAQEVREYMASLGFRTINEMVGQTQLLQQLPSTLNSKVGTIDLSALLYQPKVASGTGRYHQIAQNHQLEKSLDNEKLLSICQPAIENGQKVTASLPIRNTNRVVGTILGSEITRKYGAIGLPEDTIKLHFTGSAGQSFGAFLPHGVSLSLTGDANDHVGKGLSGGKITIAPPNNVQFLPEENVIIGNVALYGATAGEAYIRGIAGERFGVRNSGACAVVEGVGDNGCEYMTGGSVVILGRTGRNFAAGMSGGIAYVFDENALFSSRCNKQMVLLEQLTTNDEIIHVKTLIENHLRYTGSTIAQRILDNWSTVQSKFVKIVPKDYKRMMEFIADFRQQGLQPDDAVMAAFEANKNDQTRISGN